MKKKKKTKIYNDFAKKILMGSKVNELKLMSVRRERAKLASLEALKKQPRHDRFFLFVSFILVFFCNLSGF